MIVIAQGYEPEWLVIAESELFLRSQHFRHALYRTGWRLKGNLDKVSLAERIIQCDHSASCRNRLQFASGTFPVHQPNGCLDGASQLHPGRASLGYGAGKGCHRE